jgi:dienelactone hydrolase
MLAAPCTLVLALLPPVPYGAQEAPGAQAQFERVLIDAHDGNKLVAELYRASDDPATPVLVLYHQARSSRGEYRTIAPRLKERGYTCLAVDLRSGQASGDVPNLTARGVRMRGGNPTYLDALADIEDSLLWARASQPGGKLVAWGSSYSAALVLHLAGTKPELLDGVLAFAPGEYFVSLGKPETWIRDSAAGIRCPAFLTASRPEAAGMQAIFEAIPAGPPGAKVAFLPAGEGRHGSRALWPDEASSEEYWKAVEAFLGQHFPAPAPAAAGEPGK